MFSPTEIIFPTADELNRIFLSGTMVRLGDGSRRVCYGLPGMPLCVKSYRSESELDTRMKFDGTIETHRLKPSVVREIRGARFNEKLNTSCQEFRYWQKLRDTLPIEIFSVFPQVLECIKVPSRGWCLIEERVLNYDGSNPRFFSHEYHWASQAVKVELLAALDELVDGFATHAIRFYDPQNIIVQRLGKGAFRLRIVDFEPATRCLIPLDLLLPAFARLKFLRRIKRWMKKCLGVVR